MANIRLYVSALLLHAALTNAVCEDKCKPIIDLLAKCSLPPLSTDYNSIGNPTTRPQDGGTVGPATYYVDSTEKASCFCTKARESFQACTDCFDDTGNYNSNDDKMNTLFLEDCNEFGYFINKTLSYPSTTRDSMPSSTAAPSSEVKCTEADECGVVRNQVAECGLTSFDDVDPSMSLDEYFDELDSDLLPSRKAAECLCTKPVLNRLDSCSRCIGSAIKKAPGDNISLNFAIARGYGSGCFKFGYYADAEVNGPSKSASGGASQTSGGAGPAQTDKTEEDAAAVLWDGGIVALLGITSAMSMLWAFI